MNRDVCEHGNPEPCDKCNVVALRLVDELDADEWIAGTRQWREEAAAELRRLHAENERLGNLCYDYIGELTAMRAAKQMQKRIDELKKMQERTLTDEVIADLWHQNGGFHHHFARAVERWLKGQA
jgi:hypothetical protein